MAREGTRIFLNSFNDNVLAGAISEMSTLSLFLQAKEAKEEEEREHLSYSLQYHHSTSDQPSFIAPPMKRVQFHLTHLQRDRDRRLF